MQAAGKPASTQAPATPAGAESAAADVAAAAAGAAAVAQPSSSSSGSSGAGGAQGDSQAAASQAAGQEAVEGVEDTLARLRLAAQQSDSIVDQLAAKYCSGGGGLEGGPGEAEVAPPPARPLHWFGSLVPPSLRDAEGHFGRALALAVEAANSQRRLRRGLDGYRAAAAATAGQG